MSSGIGFKHGSYSDKTALFLSSLYTVKKSAGRGEIPLRKGNDKDEEEGTPRNEQCIHQIAQFPRRGPGPLLRAHLLNHARPAPRPSGRQLRHRQFPHLVRHPAREREPALVCGQQEQDGGGRPAMHRQHYSENIILIGSRSQVRTPFSPIYAVGDGTSAHQPLFVDRASVSDRANLLDLLVELPTIWK